MPLLETAALGLAGALAKDVAKAIVGKDSVVLDAAGVLIDVLKGQGEKSLSVASDAHKIETLSRAIAEQTLKTFNREGSGFTDDDQRRIKAEVAATIASVPLTSQFIIERNNDTERIARDVIAHRAAEVSQAQLSAPEQAVYERMVTECTRGISQIVTSVDSFVPHMLGEAMRRQQDFEGLMLNALVQRMAYERDEQRVQDARAFEQRYRGLVKERFDKFELFGIRDVEVSARRSLSEAYVSLSVQGVMRGERELQQQSIEQAVALSPRLVVTGIAGGGKSTLVKYLTVKAVTDGLPNDLHALRDVAPFVLRLRHYPDQAFPNIEDWLATEFPMLPAPPSGWVRQQLEYGRALVLVDGIDEMPEAKRSDLLDALRQLVRLYPAARYVITSRPAALQVWAAWREWIEDAGFTHVEMNPMSHAQRMALVTRWFGEYRKTERDTDRLRRLKDMEDRLNTLISSSPPLESLASNPLMCAMVCALYEMYGDSLPQRRTDLYDKCIDMALSLRDEQRSVHAARDYKVIDDKRPLLQHVAAWMMPMARIANQTEDQDRGEAEQEQTSVDKARLIEHMDTWLSERNQKAADGADLCRFYIERAALLREPLVGIIEFEHRTFQEYLAARELCKEDHIEELRPRLTEDGWREVIVLTAGSANRPQRNTLFSMIHAPNGLTMRQKLMLLLDCLTLVGSDMTQYERAETVLALPRIATLTTLSLHGPQVSDLSALAALTSLTTLDLRNTQVSDLSALAALTSLTTLSLDGTQVSDLSALAHLPALTVLDVRKLLVTDLTVLRPLAQAGVLRKLAVTVAQWSEANEAVLRGANPALRVFVTLDGEEYLPEKDEA